MSKNSAVRKTGLSIICRLTVVVTAFAQPLGGAAQVIVPGRPAGARTAVSDSSSATGPSTRDLFKRFDRAQKMMADDNFAEASRLLQTILESDEDVFIKSDGPTDVAEQSLKLKAHLLLAQMPAEGRAAYEQQQGPAARRLLEDAFKSHDVEAISLVARRYFHTPAGHDATYHLAADHFDHDRPLLAAVGYERLLAAPGASSRFEPYLSIRCATSWTRAGLPDKALEVLVGLHRRYSKRTMTVAGRDVELFEDPAQGLSWLATTVGPAPAVSTSGPREWTTVGGDASRNSPSSGGSPYLNRGWRVSTLEGATNFHEHDVILARVFEARRPSSSSSDDDAAVPSLSSLQPLVVDDRVIVRSIGDLRAYEIATGRLVWATGEKDQILHDVLQTGLGPQAPQAQIGGNTLLSSFVASRAGDDTTFGTLSSDGELVFVVEDLQMNPTVVEQNQPRKWPNYNRLVAYDVKTGCTKWEAGGPRGATDDALASSFFLGAPLVLDRRLYALIETGGDVRLVVLDPRTGRLDWQQTLTTPTPTDVPSAYTRRQSGLSPSFSGDILVCPIGSEQVVALSLSQRNLSWRYRLQQPAELYEPPVRRRLGPRPNLGRPPNLSSIDQNSWLDSHATIADLRVVVTPHGSDELSCLNLLDGSLVWKKPRGEGLFVAGIHRGKVLVVGRSFVTALKLTDGEPAWSKPAGLPVPSGRGFVAGEYLHLPLSTAEVATISLHDGRVVARARSLAGNVPGNLVAVRGMVVSQGGDFVEAYRQLDALEVEIADLLVRNPDDPEALALRGEIQLQRGKTAEAYADLKRALELKSDDAAIRSLLVGSLLEGLRVDFEAYRRLDVEIESLATAPEERSAYLWLKAVGLNRAGETSAALDTLLRFGDPRIEDQELERIDGALVVRRDRLVRARTAELFAAAPSELRGAAVRAVAAQAATLRDRNDGAGLRRLFRYFGGSIAQTELDRLNVELPFDADWLANEFRLESLAHSVEPQVAATANARLAQLLLTADRPRDALAIARRLAERWPDIVALDGKTGRALADEWIARSEVAREAALESPWPTGLIDVERLGAVGPAAQRHFDIPLVGERGPGFQDTLIQIGFNWRDLSARDSLGRELWKLPLDFPVTQGRPLLNRAYTSGHLLLLSIGPELLAIDVLGTADEPGPRLLWNFSLRAAGAVSGVPQRRIEINPRRRFVYNEMGELVGTIGPVTNDHITVLAGRKLMALDPLTGKPMWAREGVQPGTELFGDERLVYAVPPEGARAMVIDAIDGGILGERPLPPASKRVETRGAQVITWRTKDARQVLSRFDPWSGKDLWSRDFEDTAQLALIEFDEAAVLEISGKLSVLSLADGQVRFVSPSEPEPDLRQLHVIRSRDEYVVIANQPPEVTGWQQVTPQTIPVHGRIYGFDRKTGRRLWTTEVYRQGVDLNQPAELPVLTFLCHYSLQKNNLPGFRTYFGLSCMDKRNGRLAIDNREFDEQLLFVEYTADKEQKQLDLRLFRSILRLTFTEKPLPSP